MAKLNPDFYTVWNYRKDYLMEKMSSEEKKGLVTALTYSQQDAIQNLMKREMDLTEDIIRNKDPKCYAVWHHRRWVFKQCVTSQFSHT